MASPATAASPELYEATRLGLLAVPKELPAVWLYDARGSQLYEEITRLPEYYLPRREAEILRGRRDSRDRLGERAFAFSPSRTAIRIAAAHQPSSFPKSAFSASRTCPLRKGSSAKSGWKRYTASR